MKKNSAMDFFIGLLIYMILKYCFKLFAYGLLYALKGLYYLAWLLYFIFWLLDCGCKLISWSVFGQKGTKPRYRKLSSPDELWKPHEQEDAPSIANDTNDVAIGGWQKLLETVLKGVVYLSVFAFIFWMSSGDDSWLTTNQPKEVRIYKAKVAEDLKQLPDVKKSFDRAMIQRFGTVYESCQLDNYELIHIYVKPGWYDLSEGNQKSMIVSAANIFKDLLKNRSIGKHDVSIFFVDSATQKNVGSWGDFSGASVNKQ